MSKAKMATANLRALSVQISQLGKIMGRNFGELMFLPKSMTKFEGLTVLRVHHYYCVLVRFLDKTKILFLVMVYSALFNNVFEAFNL